MRPDTGRQGGSELLRSLWIWWPLGRQLEEARKGACPSVSVFERTDNQIDQSEGHSDPISGERRSLVYQGQIISTHAPRVTAHRGVLGAHPPSAPSSGSSCIASWVSGSRVDLSGELGEGPQPLPQKPTLGHREVEHYQEPLRGRVAGFHEGAS